jgi:group I intron endonuclease
VNQNFYIGVTKRGLRTRVSMHLYDAKRGKGHHLHAAIRKYGAESILFSVVQVFQGYAEALAFEAVEIERLKPPYNISAGGIGRSAPLSEEAKEKMRAAKAHLKGKPSFFAGKKHTPETIQRMREAKLGQPGPWAGKKRPDAAIWLSAAHKGRPPHNKGVPMREESKHKLRVTMTGRVNPSARVFGPRNLLKAVEALRKPVICLDDGSRFDSAVGAEIFYGLPKDSVSGSITRNGRVRKGKRKFAYEVAA